MTLDRVRTTSGYLNAGTCTWYLLNEDGTQVTGGTGSMAYDGLGLGRYVGVIDAAVVTPSNVTNGKNYIVKVVFVSGSNNLTKEILTSTSYQS